MNHFWKRFGQSMSPKINSLICSSTVSLISFIHSQLLCHLPILHVQLQLRRCACCIDRFVLLILFLVCSADCLTFVLLCCANWLSSGAGVQTPVFQRQVVDIGLCGWNSWFCRMCDF